MYTMNAKLPAEFSSDPGSGQPSRAFWVWTALPALLLNTLIAAGITVFGDHGFFTNLVYSQCIGLTIWLLIHVATVKLITHWQTQWRWLALIVPLGAITGLLIGTAMADLILGHNSAAYWSNDPRKAWGFLAISLTAGTALTYFFVSRAQIAQERTNAEAALRQAAESRLRLLESQLEPHMLFNTLANLRVLMGVDPAKAQTMLDHLVDYLRATLNASRTNNSSHTLDDEFNRLRDYLELMTVRMGTRLSYTLELPPELKQRKIPPLLLQALVENSIKHGLEPKVTGGNICITASEAGDTLTLVVSDTGVGSSVDLNQPLHTNGFGVAQVCERLQTAFGDDATIHFIANSPSGTRASITFPSQS
jgi:signal transduction histidine kinase